MDTPNCDVLVVDDEIDTLFLARKILEKNNYTVKTATNGMEALGMIRKGTALPRLILLDLMMPKGDGWYVLETLKKNEELKSIKVIIFTVKSFTKDIDKAKALGADNYLTKPFRAEKLVEFVRERLKENSP
ncbi:MAG: response regulator receiver protein [Promethearchaeota archaeon CR_4]|nr:MAG: response regulator receiver protein [Candidatus Lokiarchaeota archaeon CR_4]